MKRKKFTIDLGYSQLTDNRMKKLLSDIHSAVNKNLKKNKTTSTVKSKPRGRILNVETSAQKVTATIMATFTQANPGLSELHATLQGVTKKLTQTGTLEFINVATGDVIMIQGKSLGNSEISIDVKASPPKMKFAPGTFNFNFFIL